MEEAEESQREIQQTLVECRKVLTEGGMDPASCDRRAECRKVLTEGGMDPASCDRRAEQARQQINESLNQ